MQVEVVVVGSFEVPGQTLAYWDVLSFEHKHVNFLQLELFLDLVSMLLRRKIISVFFKETLASGAHMAVGLVPWKFTKDQGFLWYL